MNTEKCGFSGMEHAIGRYWTEEDKELDIGETGYERQQLSREF